MLTANLSLIWSKKWPFVPKTVLEKSFSKSKKQNIFIKWIFKNPKNGVFPSGEGIFYTGYIWRQKLTSHWNPRFWRPSPDIFRKNSKSSKMTQNVNESRLKRGESDSGLKIMFWGIFGDKKWLWKKSSNPTPWSKKLRQNFLTFSKIPKMGCLRPGRV